MNEEIWLRIGPPKPFKGGELQACVMLKVTRDEGGLLCLSLDEAQQLVNQLEHILETARE